MCKSIIKSDGDFTKASINTMIEYANVNNVKSYKAVSSLRGLPEISTLPQTLVEGLKTVSSAYECSFVDTMGDDETDPSHAKLMGYNGTRWLILVSYDTPEKGKSLDGGFRMCYSAEQPNIGSPKGTR